MAHGDDQIQSLREALELSPDNRPLRVLLANMLTGLGRFEEAEQLLREAMADAPEHLPYKLTLAKVYHQMGKSSQALVILETLAKRRDLEPASRVLFARLLFQTGDVPNAVAQYKLAIEADRTVADSKLANELGITNASDTDTAEVVDGRIRSGQGGGGPNEFTFERPKIDFKSVGGMDSVKEEIAMKIIHPLRHPEIYKAYGKAIGGGILVYGPPGCGKTHLARATAGELGAGFLAVGISDVLDMWVGNSERNLHTLFEQARSNRPCVLFFDEVDALGGKRNDHHMSGVKNLVNLFLSEMDGVQHSNEGVLILAATNAPWQVDPAFRRPGRFDRVLFVPPPDVSARADILRIHLKGKPQQSIDFDSLARATEHFSGADLKAVVDLAIEHKLREAMKTGIPHPLTTADLTLAAGRQKPTTREWFSTARNYVLYSNQGGLYDDVAKYLNM